MRKRISAYTLIDVIIVLAILTLLFTALTPDFQFAIGRQKGEVIIRDVASMMNFARISSVNTGRIVTMCRSNNGLSCKGKWLDGILIFTDTNADRMVNDEDKILRHHEFAKDEGTLRLRAFPNRQYVQFTPLGFTKKQNGNFTWCPNTGNIENAQQLIFSQSGRVRLARDKNKDGIREAANGEDIRC